VTTPQSAIALIAQLGSLAGTVIVLGKVLMNLVEQFCPKSRNTTRPDSGCCSSCPCCCVAISSCSCCSSLVARVRCCATLTSPSKKLSDLELENRAK